METTARFKRDFASLDGIFALADDFLAAQQIDQSHRFTIAFALEEIFTNFVKYNANGRSDIDVTLQLADGELKMILVDHDSAAFDLTRDAPRVDITRPLEEREPGGLGIQLVTQMVDRVEYAHGDRTSTVTLYKQVR